jgi:DNA repair exonuclease SbcCD ATPase subunit
MIEFQSVEFWNFLSFKYGLVNLSSRGVVYIKGENRDAVNTNSNDAGKTNIFEAITWALYERLSKIGKVRAGDSVVNTEAGKDCCVRLSWIQNSTQYEVLRYRKHTEYKDNVYLTGGELNAGGKRAATNDEIAKCIGMTYEMYLRSVLWAQGSSIRRLTQLTDAEFKLLFDELIGTEHFNRKLSVVKQRKLAAQNEVDSLEYTKHELETKIVTKAEEVAKVGIRIVPSKIKEIQTAIRDHDKRNQEKTALMSQYRTHESEVAQLESVIANLHRRIQDDTVAMNSVEIAHRELKCSQCGQSLRSDKSKEGVEKKIRECRERIAQMRNQYKQTTEKRQGQLIVIKKELEKIQRLDNVLVNLRGCAQGLLKEIGLFDPNQPKPQPLAQALYDFNVAVANQHRVGVLKNEIRTLRVELSKINKALHVAKDNLLTYCLLEEPYSLTGMRIYKLEEWTPHLNARARKYASILSGSALSIRFTTTEKLKSGEMREKYGITVETKSGAEFNLSGGGMIRRADVIAALALDDLRSMVTDRRTNLKIYDEATDGLDASGESCFVSLLREECRGTSFFVSHKALVSDNCFDDIELVRKENGVSQIV